MNLNSKRAAIQKYDRCGWTMTPTRGKKAYRPGWQTERLGCEEMAEMLCDRLTENIGVLLGSPSGWLIDVDLDHPLAVEIADDYLPATGAVFGHASKRRSHWLYIVTAPVETQQHRIPGTKTMIVELRSSGTQTVFPGSVHDSGEPIEWDTDNEPTRVTPEELSQAVARLADAVRGKLGNTITPPRTNGHAPTPHTNDRANTLDRDKIIDRAANYLAKIPPAISGQGGQDATFHAACELFRFGLTDAEARRLFDDFNSRCEPPWSDHDINHKLSDARDEVVTAGEFGCRLTNNRSPSPTRSTNHQPAGEQSEPPDEQHDDQPESRLPAITLPGGSTTITESATRFGNLFAKTGHTYRRGDSVSELSHDQDGQPILSIVKPARLASSLESVAKLTAIKKTKDGFEEVPTTCSETTARLILNAGEFLNRLPSIHVLSPCPVIVERDGQLITIVGYDRESGVLAAGEPPPNISIDDARKLLDEITADFRYTSPADRSRHLASIITPALVLGGLLGGRAPVDLTEANESQAGKGYRNKLTSAIFNMKLKTITQRKSGVGGIEESFSSALVSGAAFICLDNLRDKVDLPALESFLTEDVFMARVPYSGDIEIDARRIIVMLTSNKAEITTDLANRSGIVRILKQPDGYQFRQYSEGDILDHVHAHQSRYLGAVFAVIKAWHAAGKPRTNETRHDFRRWATTLDWIVQNLLGCPPLLDGHRETQRRMATPALTWLRDVALAVARSGKTGEWLRTHQLLDIAEAAGLELPGAKDDTNLDDDASRNKVLRAIGKKLGGCFREDKTTIDDVTIHRRQTLDHEFRQRPEYQFTAGTDAAAP